MGTAQSDGHGIETAFPICLCYLLDLLAHRIEPARIPDDLPQVEHHHRARLQLQRDYQAYQPRAASRFVQQRRQNVQRHAPKDLLAHAGRQHLLIDDVRLLDSGQGYDHPAGGSTGFLVAVLEQVAGHDQRRELDHDLDQIP